MAQNASQLFDISVWQFLCPVMIGGVVDILLGTEAWDPSQLLSKVDQDKITLLEIVPSHFSRIIDALDAKNFRPNLTSLHWLLLAGETLSTSLCNRWFQHFSTSIVNVYGPAECSDDVTAYVVKAQQAVSARIVPIGTPLPNNTIYILTEALKPVPYGVVGELYIGGIGVGSGYLNDETKTNSSFIPNPFLSSTDSRLPDGRMLYKTGDLVRSDFAGNLTFISRIDHQVKIRGYRIELEEIESVLITHPDILQCRVVVPRDQELVCYYTTKAEEVGHVDENELKIFLLNMLPGYMVPQYYFELDKLPMTINGKIDSKKLSLLNYKKNLKAELTRPQTHYEHALKNLWADLLGHRMISTTTDFFDTGGHSLMAIKLVTQINVQFAKKLTVSWLYQYKTIVSQAKYILDNATSEYQPYIEFPSSMPNNKAALFFVHPAEAGSEVYSNMASMQDSSYTFYAIENYNLYHEQSMLPTLPELAAQYNKYIIPKLSSGDAKQARFEFQ